MIFDSFPTVESEELEAKFYLILEKYRNVALLAAEYYAAILTIVNIFSYTVIYGIPPGKRRAPAF